MKICISCSNEMADDEYECRHCQLGYEKRDEDIDESYICTQIDDFWDNLEVT